MNSTVKPGIDCVDDGSRDGSTEQIRELGERDKKVKPIIFAGILDTKYRHSRIGLL
jgi:glycosyltransferase involved in cell wall biosynthesis